MCVADSVSKILLMLDRGILILSMVSGSSACDSKGGSKGYALFLGLFVGVKPTALLASLTTTFEGTGGGAGATAGVVAVGGAVCASGGELIWVEVEAAATAPLQ